MAAHRIATTVLPWVLRTTTYHETHSVVVVVLWDTYAYKENHMFFRGIIRQDIDPVFQ